MTSPHTAAAAATSFDRAAELSLRERAGLLFHPMLFLGDTLDVDARPPWGGPSIRELIDDRAIRFFCLGAVPEPERLREHLDTLQAVARESGDGPALVFSTDPRHSFLQIDGASHAAKGLSQWPEPIGFGALGDEDLVRTVARTVRRDYVAMGIRMALHPQIDLATEPRWARQAQSFGADPGETARLVRAFIEGLQGEDLADGGVAATTKHFPGGGAQLDGEDPHFPYGREQVYPGGWFERHLEPFRAAIDAGTAAVMPYYGMPVGLERGGRAIESVGFAFNRQIITDLLRDELGFDGVVLSDFGLVTDQEIFGKPLPARAWGVEHLDRESRVARLFSAGVDQLGGESDVDLALTLVQAGAVSEERMTEAASRVLALQERLAAGTTDPAPPRDDRAAIELGRETQARAVTVLTNRARTTAPILPLTAPVRVHLDGLDESALPAGFTAHPLEDADVAIVRVGAPFDRRDDYFLEAGMQQGSLDFDAAEVARIRALAAVVPVVLAVTLSRPAVLTELVDVATAVVGEYGADDGALLDALTGRIRPEGRLPFELPRSMAAVAASRPDVASDTVDPLFLLGWKADA
jgi:beta-glucosidase